MNFRRFSLHHWLQLVSYVLISTVCSTVWLLVLIFYTACVRAHYSAASRSKRLGLRKRSSWVWLAGLMLAAMLCCTVAIIPGHPAAPVYATEKVLLPPATQDRQLHFPDIMKVHRHLPNLNLASVTLPTVQSRSIIKSVISSGTLHQCLCVVLQAESARPWQAGACSSTEPMCAQVQHSAQVSTAFCSQAHLVTPPSSVVLT